MSEILCLYCDKIEGRGYKPPKGWDYVCSGCVTGFLDASQDYLKWLHSQAIKNSMPNKAWALESFKIPEEKNATRPQKHGRCFDRKGSLRPAANKKSGLSRLRIDKQLPFCNLTKFNRVYLVSDILDFIVNRRIIIDKDA